MEGSRTTYQGHDDHGETLRSRERIRYRKRYVDDLIMVGSSLQLCEVVGEMKQYFAMKVTHPLPASSTQTYVGARYLRHGDAIWKLPTARCVTGMLNEHDMQNAKSVFTPAVNRNDGDDDDEEASAEEHRSLRRIVGKSQFLAPRGLRHCFCYEPSGEVSGKTSSKLLLRYLRGTQDFGLRLQVQNRVVLNSDSVHRQRLGWRWTHSQVRVFVGNHAGWILDQCRCPNRVSDCSIVM